MIPSREYETNNDAWRARIEERLDALESPARSGDKVFDPSVWHGIGRFNSLFSNDVFIGLGSEGETIRLNSSGFKINNSGDNSVYMNFYNSGITDYPAAHGFVNLQQGAPDATYHGTMNVGIEHDANSQSVTYWCLGEIDHMLKSGGVWKFVESIFYDRVNYEVVIRPVQLSADPAGGEAGDIYYNSTTNKLKVRENSTWRTITTS